MVIERRNIEAERGSLQLTKGELCAQLGITLKTYNGYLRGASIPSNILETLKGLTGKTIDYLLGLDTDKGEAHPAGPIR